MPDVVIRARGLGKKYLIGHETERERYVALRDVLARAAKRLARSARDMMRGRQLVAGSEIEEFWALRDIDFEIARGEVVGIIGRNGAGKSTLLKILSRITEPSAGRVEIRGRVASLLEVGTGFHPELTGRENIYLNGAILGMTRAEIRAKFDEIVAFAEVEKFLDTPVKRYSSGMYVRLAFAVAAHLEPEILVVDEVLAVGDAEFQKKCLGKMKDVAGHGRTVLFVSHNMAAVTALCTRALMLKSGTVACDGDVTGTVARYLSDAEMSNAYTGRKMDVTAGSDIVRTSNGPAVVLIFDIMLRGPLSEPRIGIGINDAQGTRIATLFSETFSRLPAVGSDAPVALRIRTEPLRLAPGTLSFKVALAEAGSDIEVSEDRIRLIVPDYLPYERAPYGRARGFVHIRVKIEFDENVHKIPA
ncbi:MAG: ATP-binding cassette domain-containing protein [Rhizobiales bacterium]|nr:ATP-binding cassette domain-containing protein [Hyphomicrobiales bacterium]